MQLTSHTDYALRMLIYLMSDPARKVTTKEVAEAYRISLNHLTKVAKSLTRGGWLVATRGAGGGLKLAPHTPDARIGQIVRYTENAFDIAECFDTNSNTCPIARVCQLKPVLYRARRAFFEVLDSCTLREIASNPVELMAVFNDSGLLSPASGAVRPELKPRAGRKTRSAAERGKTAL